MTAAAATPALPPRSPFLFGFMARQFTSFFRRNMNALRVAGWGQLDAPEGVPLVVYSNHPSWWDAALFIMLGKLLLPDRASFAPIDAKMLEKYKFFGRIGAFGLDLESRRGAVAFLQQAGAILAKPDRALWITAQGTFRDVRARPIGLRPGIAHLTERAPGAAFVPLAIEYDFWTERGAEALVAFGRPMGNDELAGLSRPERLAALERALTGTMDRLAEDAIARDPARFTYLIQGRQGIGGIYDLWRGAKARLRGERFEPGHLEQRP